MSKIMPVIQLPPDNMSYITQIIQILQILQILQIIQIRNLSFVRCVENFDQSTIG